MNQKKDRKKICDVRDSVDGCVAQTIEEWKKEWKQLAED